MVVSESLLPNAGHGLFADTDFKKNQIITEYGGEVISSTEALERKKNRCASHIRSLAAMHMCIDGLLVSPTDDSGGGASFINDPRGAKPYNCKFVVKQQTDGVTRTGLFTMERCFVVATVDIRRSEELYVAYGKDYWGDVVR